MGKLFISIWKKSDNQDYFDIRLIIIPEKALTETAYEINGICSDLDAKNLLIKEFSIHRGKSLATVARYILQQINNEFAFNKDIDEDGIGMREWISPMDKTYMKLFIRSAFEPKVKATTYN
jgi:hypothetical protein